MRTFFTSDTHFGHANIIKYCDRPFSSVGEMDEAMIANWNRRIEPNDVVYHLGDFAFGCDLSHAIKCLKRLKGEIRFIKGNHDKHLHRLLDEGVLTGWGHTLQDYAETAVEGQKLVLFHYGLRTWHHSLRGVWHLYGHSHNMLPPLGKSVDVGVDRWDFAPVSMEQLRRFMDERPVDKDDPTFVGYVPPIGAESTQ